MTRETLIQDINALYLIYGCEAGGPLHIVLDDYNIEDGYIRWCLSVLDASDYDEGRSVERDHLVRRIALALLDVPERDRQALIRSAFRSP